MADRSDNPLMKDGLGEAAVSELAGVLASAQPRFPRKRFVARALEGLDALELKERVLHVIAAMASVLPADFREAAPILEAAGERWPPRGEDADPLSGFARWPLIDYVAEHGLDHPELALPLLGKLTPLFSAEFAVRPFLVRYPEQALAALEGFARDEDEHVRRLASEGTRPRLPWGIRLPAFQADPAPVLALLEHLRDDPSLTVRRSVANNLNDISKDNPEAVIATCRRWQRGASDERQWVIGHATRTLVKAGHPDVFPLLGYTAKPKLAFEGLRLAKKTVAMGEDLNFRFRLHSKARGKQKIVVDYAIHHVKANGKTTAKVFKLKTLELAAGATVELAAKRPFRQITTRRYHAGRHAVEILVNGCPLAKRDFELVGV